jgi:5-formyltetrahydrofolate cyclo-ligase
VVTTVHERQIVAGGRIPVTDHDFRLDLIVTAERVITCPGRKRRRRRSAIRWDELTAEKIDTIPVLRALRG